MKKRLLAIFACVVLVMGIASMSHALPIFTLDDGVSAVVSITDNLAGDLNPASGVVTYSGTIGVWDINVSTGITMPAQGSPASPYMDLNSINHSTGAGTMTVTFTEGGFTQLGGVNLSAGGTTAGSVAFSALINNVVVASLGSFGPVSFSGDASGTTGQINIPYSLSLVANISHEGAGTTSFDAQVTVPEPTTLLLLGFGLIGLVGVGRKLWK